MRHWIIGVVLLGMAGVAAALPVQRDPAQRMWRDVAQRKDKELRARTLEQLEGMLRQDAGQQATALRVLARLRDVPFERASFLKRARDLLKSEDPQVRAAALGALAPLGADELDVGAAAELVDDPDPNVRAQVAGAIAAVSQANADRGPFEPHPAIEKLLADLDLNVRRQTVRYLWGVPLTEKAEEMLVAMSRHIPLLPAQNELANDVVYYALSTRPLISKTVAARLIEVMQDAEHTYANRAAWGLSHHPWRTTPAKWWSTPSSAKSTKPSTPPRAATPFTAWGNTGPSRRSRSSRTSRPTTRARASGRKPSAPCAAASQPRKPLDSLGGRRIMAGYHAQVAELADALL